MTTSTTPPRDNVENRCPDPPMRLSRQSRPNQQNDSDQLDRLRGVCLCLFGRNNDDDGSLLTSFQHMSVSPTTHSPQ